MPFSSRARCSARAGQGPGASFRIRLGGRRYVNRLWNVGSAIGSSSGFRVALVPRQDVKRELPARPLDPSACLGDATSDFWVDRPRRWRSAGCSLEPRFSAQARDRHDFSFVVWYTQTAWRAGQAEWRETLISVPTWRPRSRGWIKDGHRDRDHDADGDQRDQRVLQWPQAPARTAVDRLPRQLVIGLG